MPEPILRKLSTAVEKIYHEGGPVADVPLWRGAVTAVIHNPFAGRYVADIKEFIEHLRPLPRVGGLESADAIGKDGLK
jgi:hypothetical protein